MTAHTGMPGAAAGIAPDAQVTLAVILAAAGPGSDPALIERAYKVAEFWHRGQWRRSGDPYITHPLAVALILAEMGMSPPMLCAALLHDVIEDTACPAAELRRQFGDQIADLVDQLTGLHAMPVHQLAELAAAGTATGNDVLILKLADRLHNMRTVRFIAPAKQQRKSRLDGIGCEMAGLATAVLADARPDQTASLASQRGGPALSRRLLAATTLLLPGPQQGRWLEEWTGELATLPTRRDRTRFAVSMLAGMPALAVTLRLPSPAQSRRP